LAATIPLLSVWQAPPLAQAVAIEGWEPEEEALVGAGIRVPLPLPTLSVTRWVGGQLPETMSSTSSVRLVSARIQELLLRALGDQVQLLEASVAGSAQRWAVPNPLELRPCRVGPEGQIALPQQGGDLPALFRTREMPSVWIVRADLERRLRSETAGEFVPLHQFRLFSAPRYGALTEDGWQ
jgi:hypothetical protein